VAASELAAVLSPTDPRAIASAIKSIGELLGIDRLRARIVAGGQSGSTRPVTVQVVNRRGIAVRSRCLVRFYIATAEGGDPAGAQTVTVTTGSVRDTHEANREYTVLSSADGLVGFSLGLAGAGTRYLYATVGNGDFQGSGAVEFT
jgi:hypothetical protein